MVNLMFNSMNGYKSCLMSVAFSVCNLFSWLMSTNSFEIGAKQWFCSTMSAKQLRTNYTITSWRRVRLGFESGWVPLAVGAEASSAKSMTDSWESQLIDKTVVGANTGVISASTSRTLGALALTPSPVCDPVWTLESLVDSLPAVCSPAFVWG